jgi:hypothetical protein
MRRCSCSAAWAWCSGVTVERLYREIRALRIYEGASEVLEADHRRQYLVATSLATHRPTPWPDDVRQAIHQFMEIS